MPIRPQSKPSAPLPLVNGPTPPVKEAPLCIGEILRRTNLHGRPHQPGPF